MTPLERAARALYPIIASAHDFNDLGFPSYDDADPDSWVKEQSWEAARAVLTEIREPSEGMIAAAGSTPGIRATDRLLGIARSMGHDLDRAALLNGPPVQQAWQAMIDAALAEEGE